MVTADLRASKVSCHVDIDAPREGRPQTRVNWLLRQLKEAPDDLRVEAFLMHGRGDGTAELLGAVRESPKLRELVPEDTEQAVEEALVSTALSSQDEPETSDATAAVRRAVRTRIAGDTLMEYVGQNGSRWATDL